MRTSDSIRNLLGNALESARKSGAIPPFGHLEEIFVTEPPQPEFGDYSSNVALIIAGSAGVAPMELAERIADAVEPSEVVAEVFAARPGFINFRLSPDWLRSRIPEIEQQGLEYGRSNFGDGKRVQVEFVSVNPTGPLHIGHARGAVLGEGIAKVLHAVGYDVQREYYLNDAGEQIKSFGNSAYAKYIKAAGKSPDEEGLEYAGPYMDALGARLLEELGPDLADIPKSEALPKVSETALNLMVSAIRATLERIGIMYDAWRSERDLMHKGGLFEEAMGILQEKGCLAERDGAIWFLATQFGGEEDYVVVRRGQGGPTYFGTDIAYHYDKLLKRKFDRVVNIWGADHHGHEPRLINAMTALGGDESKLTIIFNQIVHLKEGGENKKFSKREGNFISMDELLDAVGVDNCIYTFMSRNPDSQMEFDIQLTKSQSAENPAYYVKYAHARICSILGEAKKRGIEFAQGDISLLTHPREMELLKSISAFPDVVHQAAVNFAPQHIPKFAYETAKKLQVFYEECRVLPKKDEARETALARLRLVSAVQVLLVNVLNLMGMSAPKKM